MHVGSGEILRHYISIILLYCLQLPIDPPLMMNVVGCISFFLTIHLNGN